MFELISEENEPYRRFGTRGNSQDIVKNCFEWRMKGNQDVQHAIQRLGYHGELKGRVAYETLACDDGELLYRITVDGHPLLYDDEDNIGSWLTEQEVMCYIEGYTRLTKPNESIISE